MTRSERLREIARIAVGLENDFNVPAQMTVAQWAVESKWGEKPVGKNNYFGIKDTVRKPGGTVNATKEEIDGKLQNVEQPFESYKSLADSAADYAWLISQGKPYRAAWNTYQAEALKYGTLVAIPALILNVAKVYATSKEYGELVLKIAFQKNVMAAIQKAKLEATLRS